MGGRSKDGGGAFQTGTNISQTAEVRQKAVAESFRILETFVGRPGLRAQQPLKCRLEQLMLHLYGETNRGAERKGNREI